MQDRQLIVFRARAAAYVWLAIAALLPVASLGQSGPVSKKEETAKATQALITWFDCVSCGKAELDAVISHGQSVVPSLAATLNAGLSAADRRALQESFAVRYDELDQQARRDPKFKMKSTKDQFVARYVDEYDARNRIRAAEALGAIGGSNARAALKTALGNARRADVRQAIGEALEEAGSAVSRARRGGLH